MRNVITSVVIVLSTSAAAWAQTASEHLLLARTAGVSGEVVVIRDDGRGNVRGRLIGVTDEELEIETRSGRRWLDLSRVVRVEEPGDSIRDGAFRGVGTATAWCVLTCERTENGSVHPATFAGYVAIGGFIGAAIDRRINGTRTIYRRPTPAIHLGPGRVGVTVVF